MIMKDIELSIVIPTYNERENIVPLIERIEKCLKDIPIEILVVDDNSPDGTADLAEELGKKYGNIRVLRRGEKLGLGSAVSQGINQSRGKVIAIMDADLQHPPELLPKMLEKIKEGYDVVIASRYVKGGGTVGWSVWRKIISRGAVLLTRVLLPFLSSIEDAVSGYFMFKRVILGKTNVTASSYKVMLEILSISRYRSIIEIPYIFTARSRGNSKLSLKEIVSYPFVLLNLHIAHIKSKRKDFQIIYKHENSPINCSRSIMIDDLNQKYDALGDKNE